MAVYRAKDRKPEAVYTAQGRKPEAVYRAKDRKPVAVYTAQDARCLPQGDKEDAMGLPISPLMDRSTQGGITRSQIGFYSVVGLPAFTAMADTFEGARPMLEGAMENFRHWKSGTALKHLPP